MVTVTMGDHFKSQKRGALRKSGDWPGALFLLRTGGSTAFCRTAGSLSLKFFITSIRPNGMSLSFNHKPGVPFHLLTRRVAWAC